MNKAILALGLSFLAGCAALQEQEKRPTAEGSWIGAPYEEVVKAWGEPDRSSTVGGGRMARTWVSEGVTPTRRLYPSVGIYGDSGIGVGVGTSLMVEPRGGYEQARCERTVIFRNNVVEEQKWLGPTDFCNTFRRRAPLGEAEAKK